MSNTRCLGFVHEGGEKKLVISSRGAWETATGAEVDADVYTTFELLSSTDQHELDDQLTDYLHGFERMLRPITIPASIPEGRATLGITMVGDKPKVCFVSGRSWYHWDGEKYSESSVPVEAVATTSMSLSKALYSGAPASIKDVYGQLKEFKKQHLDYVLRGDLMRILFHHELMRNLPFPYHFLCLTYFFKVSAAPRKRSQLARRKWRSSREFSAVHRATLDRLERRHAKPASTRHCLTHHRHTRLAPLNRLPSRRLQLLLICRLSRSWQGSSSAAA